jgi:hypothetical protein
MEKFRSLYDWRLLAAFDGTLTEDQLPANERERQEALLAIAEIDHRLNGGHRCSICRAPVRSAMKSVGVDDEGKRYVYQCLCRRCLEAERRYCRTVTSYIANIVFDEFVNRRDLVPRSAEDMAPIAKGAAA